MSTNAIPIIWYQVVPLDERSHEPDSIPSGGCVGMVGSFLPQKDARSDQGGLRSQLDALVALGNAQEYNCLALSLIQDSLQEV